jgi:GH15 family glucan-1,4-alpha-glucosidase
VLHSGIGGGRNWDYRFTWIRDSSFVLYAFLKLGFKDEAKKFMKWIEKRCEEINPDGSLQIMYGLRGEHRLDELELDHLAGYKNSKPVRIGNGAFDQIQLDIYGELMDTVYLSVQPSPCPLAHLQLGFTCLALC